MRYDARVNCPRCGALLTMSTAGGIPWHTPCAPTAWDATTAVHGWQCPCCGVVYSPTVTKCECSKLLPITPWSAATTILDTLDQVSKTEEP